MIIWNALHSRSGSGIEACRPCLKTESWTVTTIPAIVVPWTAANHLLHYDESSTPALQVHQLLWGSIWFHPGGAYFLRDQEGDSASPDVITMTFVVMFGMSLILSIGLARWQWRRSSQSTQMYEVLVTGTWMLICFVLSVRPRMW